MQKRIFAIYDAADGKHILWDRPVLRQSFFVSCGYGPGSSAVRTEKDGSSVFGRRSAIWSVTDHRPVLFLPADCEFVWLDR